MNAQNQQPFYAEREAFRRFKQAVEEDPELKNEIEAVLNDLLGQFATSIYENRFIVGGALEIIITAALRAAQVDATEVGADEERLDIRIPQGGFSVKGHFSKGGDIRLINVLGKSEQARWNEATLFVLYEVGIVYADPLILQEKGYTNAVRTTGDAIAVSLKQLRAFYTSNPEWLIACAVPAPLREKQLSKLVSREIAKQIIAKTQKLKRALEDVQSRGSDNSSP